MENESSDESSQFDEVEECEVVQAVTNPIDLNRRPFLADFDFLSGTLLGHNDVDSFSNPATDLIVLDEELQIDIELAQTNQALENIQNSNPQILAVTEKRNHVSWFQPSASESATDSSSSLHDLTQSHHNSQQQQFNGPVSSDPYPPAFDYYGSFDTGKDSGVSFDSGQESACNQFSNAKRSGYDDQPATPQKLSSSLSCSRALINSAINDVIRSKSESIGKWMPLEDTSFQQPAGQHTSREEGELSDELSRNPFDHSAYNYMNGPNHAAGVDQRIDHMFSMPPNLPINDNRLVPHQPPVFGTPEPHAISYPHPIIANCVNYTSSNAGQQPALKWYDQQAPVASPNVVQQPALKWYDQQAPVASSNAGQQIALKWYDRQAPVASPFTNNNIFSQPPIRPAAAVPVIVSQKSSSLGRAALTNNKNENDEIKNLIFNKLSKSHKKHHPIDETQERKLIKVSSKPMDFDRCNRFVIDCSSWSLHEQDGFNAVYNFKTSDKVFKNRENRRVLFDRLANAPFFDKNESKADDPLQEGFDLNEEIKQNERELFEGDELLDKNEVNSILGEFNDVSASSLISDLSSFNPEPNDAAANKPAAGLDSSSGVFPASSNDPRLAKRIHDVSQQSSSPLAVAYAERSDKKMSFGGKGKSKGLPNSTSGKGKDLPTSSDKGLSASSSGKGICILAGSNSSSNVYSSANLNKPKRNCQIKGPPFQLDYNKMLDLQIRQAELKRWCGDLRKHHPIILDSYVRIIKPGITEHVSYIIVRVHSLINEDPRKLLVVCPDHSNKVIEFSSVSNNPFTEGEFNEWHTKSKANSGLMPSKDEYEQKKQEIQKALQQSKVASAVQPELSNTPTKSGISSEPAALPAAKVDSIKEQPERKPKAKQPKSSAEDNKLFKEFDTFVRPTPKISKPAVRQPVASKSVRMDDFPCGVEFEDLEISTDLVEFQGSKEALSKQSSKESDESERESLRSEKRMMRKRDHQRSLSSGSDKSVDDLAPKKKPHKHLTSPRHHHKSSKHSGGKKISNRKRPANERTSSSSSDESSLESSENKRRKTKKSSNKCDSKHQKRNSVSSSHRESRKRSKVYRSSSSISRSSSNDSISDHESRKRHKKHRRASKRHSRRSSQSSDDVNRKKSKNKKSKREDCELSEHSDDSNDELDERELEIQIRKLKKAFRQKQAKKNEAKKRAASLAASESNDAKPMSSTAVKSPAFPPPKPPSLTKFKHSPLTSGECSESGAEKQSTARSSKLSGAKGTHTAHVPASFYRSCYTSDSSERSVQNCVEDKNKRASEKHAALPEKLDKVVARMQPPPSKAMRTEAERVKAERPEPEAKDSAKLTSFGEFKKRKNAVHAERAASQSNREAPKPLISSDKNGKSGLKKSQNKMSKERLLILVKLAQQRLNTGDLKSAIKKLDFLIDLLYGDELKAGGPNEIDVCWLLKSGIAFDHDQMVKTSSYRAYLKGKYQK